MLRVHFLNVGHGDCTLIQHHSGRLTMVDINTSQEYDPDSFKELLAEEARKQYNPLAAGFGIGGGAQSAAVNALFGTPPGYGAGLLGMPTGYFEALAEAKKELADPIAFLRANYPGQRLWRFVLTHPDLDHMRGIKRLYEGIGFDNFWDTRTPSRHLSIEATMTRWIGNSTNICVLALSAYIIAFLPVGTPFSPLRRSYREAIASKYSRPLLIS